MTLTLPFLQLQWSIHRQSILYGYFFPFSYYQKYTGLDREIVRGGCRSLCNRGFMELGNGLTEDGLTAGAGYTLTMKGEFYLSELRSLIDDN